MAGLTIDDPVTLAEALASTRILPGDELLLAAGTYSGDYIASTLIGTEAKPIIIRPRDGARVIIDGSLTINGQYQLWKDIEVMYSGWITRTTEISGSAPSDIPTTKAFNLNGIGNVCNGLVIHDTVGNGNLSSGTLSKLTGCLIYNCGWNAPDRGHGHSMYIQNVAGRKTLKRCISCNSFGYAWHAYTEGGNINYIDYIETACINAGSPVQHGYQMLTGGYKTALEPHWYRNMTYNCGANLGYISQGGATDVVRVGNYLPNGCSIASVTFFEDSDNVLTKPTSGLVQFCYEDEYHPTRGFLTVYNWDKLDSITADLSAITGLEVGDNVRLRCAENYYGCYQNLTLDANKNVVVDMRVESHTVATAIAHDYTPPTNCPEFGCFVVERI